ncbi:MAG: hypothetical protein ABEJ95_04345 [Candidatus Nanohalobium sp.]
MIIDWMRSKDWESIIGRVKKGQFDGFLVPLYRAYFRWKGHEGIDVVDEDWDYLIILDACRYDVFEETNWIEGDLSKKVSKASATDEWLRKNFVDYYDDLVYVSGNAFVSPLKEKGNFDSSNHFHHTEMVYMEDRSLENGVVKPEYLAEKGKELAKKYPDKRIIFHFVQPHDPFIAEPSLVIGDGEIEDVLDYFDHKLSKEAYVANLRRALESVETLLKSLEGKAVISADHGDSFGEKGIHRHPNGVYIKELVEVPWHVVQNDDKEKDFTGIDY